MTIYGRYNKERGALEIKSDDAYIGCAISNRHWCQRWEE